MVKKFGKSSMKLGKGYGKGKKSLDTITLVVVSVSLVLVLVFALIFLYKSYCKPEHFVTSEDSTKAYQVVYVYSDTCPNCINFAPTWEQYVATQTMNRSVGFKKVEKSDPQFPHIMQQYSSAIQGFPTVIIIDSYGTLIDSKSGNMQFIDLQQFVAQNTK